MADLWAPVSGVYWSSAPLFPSLEWIGNLGNSSFFTTVIGALAGAGVGAWAAGWIAARNKLRDELQKELRSTKAALMLSQAALSDGIAFKLDSSKPLKEWYEKDLETYKKYQSSPDLHEKFSEGLNLKRLRRMNPPIDLLQSLVMGEISSAHKIIRAMVALNDSLHQMNSTIERRNNIVKSCERNELPDGFDVFSLYIGATCGGSTNTTFGDNIRALCTYNDHVIFFSLKLCEWLQEHAAALREEYRKVSSVRESGSQLLAESGITVVVAEDGTLPDEKDYGQWLSENPQVLRKDSAARKWWHRAWE